MTDVSNLTRQHKDILELLDKLGTYTNPREVEKNAFAISLLLGQLSGKINIHLSNEDRFMYPRLMNATETKTRQLSQQFSREMGGLIAVFTDFKSKYLSSAKINANATDFITELRQINGAIRERINKEELHLYPLAASAN